MFDKVHKVVQIDSRSDPGLEHCQSILMGNKISKPSQVYPSNVHREEPIVIYQRPSTKFRVSYLE